MDPKQNTVEYHKNIDFVPKTYETSATLDFENVEELRLIAQSRYVSRLAYFGNGKEWLMTIELTLSSSTTSTSSSLNLSITRCQYSGDPVRVTQSSCKVITDGTINDIPVETKVAFPGTNILSHNLTVSNDLKHLVIEVSVKYVRVDQFEKQMTLRPEPVQTIRKSSTLTSDMELLFTSGKGADMTLVIGDQRLAVHKAILMSRFPYFANMMESGMKESDMKEIEIKEEDKDTFSEIIKYIYCDQFPEDMKNKAIRLLPLADKYQLIELKEACESELEKNVTAGNVCQILILADLHKCYSLKDTCLHFIGKSRSQINSQCFEELRDYPSLLIELVKKG